MKLFELFSKPTQYVWKSKNKYLGSAEFEIGSMTYQLSVEEDEVDARFWFVSFGAKVTAAAPGSKDSFLRGDTTGTGNQFAVYSTVIAATKDYMQQFGIRPIRIIALDDSRKGLYPRMIKRILPDWSITIVGANIIAIPPQKSTS